MTKLQVIRVRVLKAASAPVLVPLLLAAIGAGAGVIATALPLVARNGLPAAGFVPAILAGLLAILGLAAAIAAVRAPRRPPLVASETEPPVWREGRPGVALCLAVVLFAALAPTAGLVAAAGVAAVVSMVASEEVGVGAMVWSVLGLMALSALLFSGLLGASVPLFGPR